MCKFYLRCSLWIASISDSIFAIPSYHSSLLLIDEFTSKAISSCPTIMAHLLAKILFSFSSSQLMISKFLLITSSYSREDLVFPWPEGFFVMMKFFCKFYSISMIELIMFKVRIKSNSLSSHKQVPSQNQEKTKSKPKKRLKAIPSIYNCLKEISSSEEHWKQILKRQLDFNWSIAAFQNSEGTFRVDPSKKLKLRETFLLKKEIISCISKQNFSSLIKKLEELRKASSEDGGLAKLFIYLLEIRKLLIGQNFSYRVETIREILTKIVPNITKQEKQQYNMFYGRIIYILALHLVKLRGVLLEKMDLKLIIEAINIKKKEFCAMNIEEKKARIQSLIFIVFEFYQVLHLIKFDQDLSLTLYNQIKAFISIWKTKLGGFEEFEAKIGLQKKLENKVPLRVNLKIYEDHDRRRVLSFQNIKRQMMKGQEEEGRQNQDEEGKEGSSENLLCISKKTAKNLLSQEKVKTNKVSALQTKTNNQSNELYFEENQIPITHEIADIFSFRFLYSENCQVFIGQFSVEFDDKLTSYSLKLVLESIREKVGYFFIDKIPIDNCSNSSTFLKGFWKVIKQIFFTDQSEILPSAFSFEFPDDQLQKVPERHRSILIRIHSIILHYIRKKPFQKKVNGRILPFPSISESKMDLLKKPSKNDQKAFTKRMGFISRNTRNHTKKTGTQFIQIVMLLRDGGNSYQTLSADYEDGELKGISIFHKHRKMKNENLLLSEKITLLKEISSMKLFPNKCRIKKILKFLFPEKSSFCLNFMKFHPQAQNGEKIEEEFEVMNSPILETGPKSIKAYRQNFKISIFMTPLPELKTLLKINNKYWPSVQQKEGMFYRYFDKNRDLYLQKQYNLKDKINYRKYRVHFTFDWIDCKGETIRGFPSKKNEGNTKFIKRNQRLTLNWKKTYVFRQQKKYFYFNLFERLEYHVFELWIFGTQLCFVGFCSKSVNIATPLHFDQKSLQINSKLQLKKIQIVEKPLCIAQIYYDSLNFE